jgi:hypothetical protein
MAPIGLTWMTQMTQDIKKVLDTIPVFRNELRTTVGQSFKINYGFSKLYEGFNDPRKYTQNPSRFESKKDLSKPNIDDIVNFELDFSFHGERWSCEGMQDPIYFHLMVWVILAMCPADKAYLLLKKMSLSEGIDSEGDLLELVKLKKPLGDEVMGYELKGYLKKLTRHKINVMRSLIALYFSCTTGPS